MGNCCQEDEIIEFNYKTNNNNNNIVKKASTVYTRKNTAYIFDTFPKHKNMKNFRKKYKYVSLIGTGAFGRVRLFVDRQYKNFKYAIKTIKKDLFNQYDVDAIKREVEILKSLDHPNIVKYFETHEDEHYLHIVMEYIAGDNLFTVLTSDEKKKFTEREISQIMLCLLKAVLFLHNNGIIHRDIKPENIVFIENGNFNALKLIDFGLSIQQNAKKDNRRVGTPYYMSPEMIKGNFVYASDVWSVGVILFIMVTGKRPFRGKCKEEVYNKISNGKYDVRSLSNARCSDELKDLIKKMLICDCNKRITIEACLEHIWFKQFDDDKKISLVVDQEIIKALREFQHQNLFQKEILYYLAKLCTDKEITKLKKAFSAIDIDNSGEIEYDEIPKIFNELGIKATDVSIFFI